MPFVETPPPPPERIIGDGDDVASSVYAARIVDLEDGTARIEPIKGFTGNATINDPARFRARLGSCRAMAADGAGCSGVDLDNATTPPRFIFNRSSAALTLGFPGLNHVVNLGYAEALDLGLGSLGF